MTEYNDWFSSDENKQITESNEGAKKIGGIFKNRGWETPPDHAFPGWRRREAFREGSNGE